MNTNLSPAAVAVAAVAVRSNVVGPYRFETLVEKSGLPFMDTALGISHLMSAGIIHEIRREDPRTGRPLDSNYGFAAVASWREAAGL